MCCAPVSSKEWTNSAGIDSFAATATGLSFNISETVTFDGKLETIFFGGTSINSSLSTVSVDGGSNETNNDVDLLFDRIFPLLLVLLLGNIGWRAYEVDDPGAGANIDRVDDD
mmetsp:Transcript_13471/g.28586  ORF Transcript_13471/g.28586 Transcript_13471/m.28586 type:complete len:113 (+) Transcript_13471:220-558(+)